ncbi:hypothetical protein HPB51_017100 [Rhipicephalus microplus]|uniref:Peptidase M20 dimerisation domain-containing protein n=1 Tax=Rhipicephalus microplus TaxID=6941 RepID=A0A9J6DWD6_RHIMP|nr:hypothetical protein HPB51_017100 [Rhipicephalus microplus]
MALANEPSDAIARPGPSRMTDTWRQDLDNMDFQDFQGQMKPTIRTPRPTAKTKRMEPGKRCSLCSRRRLLRKKRSPSPWIFDDLVPPTKKFRHIHEVNDDISSFEIASFRIFDEGARMPRLILQEQGAHVTEVSLGDQQLSDGSKVSLPPLLLATTGQEAAKKTLCVYGHLDVYPARKIEPWV